MQKGIGTVVVLLLGLVSSRSASAQSTPRDVPLGGRTATMGGAATAAGNDSAMPYLNPAGLAGVPSDVLAVSATAYSYSARNIRGFFHPNGFDPTRGPATLDNESFTASAIGELPSSVMYMKHFGGDDAPIRYAVGMSLVIPYAFSGTVVASYHATFPSEGSSTEETAAVTRSLTDYYFGPSFAMAVGDRLRIGASAYTLYVVDNRSTSYSSISLLANGSLPITARLQSAVSAWSAALVPIVGVQARVVSSLWIGASVAAPSVHLAGSASRVFDDSGSTNANAESAAQVFIDSQRSPDASYRGDRPMRANIGVAWDDRRRFSVAADAYFFFARRDAVVLDAIRQNTSIRTGQAQREYADRATYSDSFVPSIGLSAGGEVALSSTLSVRSGAFYDGANGPRFDQPSRQQLYTFRMDRYGGTLGLGINIGSFDTTVGGLYAYSNGRFLTQDTSQPSVPLTAVDASSHTFMAVLSGAVDVSAAKKKIEDNLPSLRGPR